MSGFSNSPKLLKSGLVLIDPVSARVQRIILLQYNPDSLTRTLQAQGAGGEEGNRSEAMRFKGPAVETLKLDAEIDAADQLEFPDRHRAVVENGIQPQLAMLESLVHPTSSQLLERNRMALSGTCRSGTHHRIQYYRGSLRSCLEPVACQSQFWVTCVECG